MSQGDVVYWTDNWNCAESKLKSSTITLMLKDFTRVIRNSAAVLEQQLNWHWIKSFSDLRMGQLLPLR